METYKFIKFHLKVYTLLRILFDVKCRPGNQQQSKMVCSMDLDEKPLKTKNSKDYKF